MKQICFILICTILLSCESKVEHSIDIIKVNPAITDSASLSEICSGIRIISLETSDSCLITGIQEVEQLKQYVYINDAGRRVLQFDTSGRFIKQIGREGRGPGEYLSIFSIALDSIKNTIYIATIRKILCFDASGKFLSEIKQGFFSEFITIVDNKLWSISTSSGNKTEENSYTNISRLIRYTIPDNESDTIIVKKVKLTRFSGTINQQAYYISDLGKTQYLYLPVLLAEPVMRDTIYEIKGTTMMPSLKLDFGKSGEPRNGKKQVYLRNIYKTADYLFAEYLFEGKKIVFCHNWIRKTDFNIMEGFSDDFYGTGIVQLKPLDLQKEAMYFVKEAFDLSGKIEGVSENSNPVLFFVKLKNN